MTLQHLSGTPAVQRRIAAVVLNYRTLEQTCLAIRSLQASRLPFASIIVVDNGSEDGSAEALSRLTPAVRLIAPRQNLGFSGGCNLGIREALANGCDAVLLFNSDAILPPETLQSLQQTLFESTAAGIVGPVLLSLSTPDVVLSRGMDFSSRTGRMWHRGFGERCSAAESVVATVPAVSGGAMLIRREVFERVGLLDERYFFSFEDLEFCLRASKAGFLTVVDERAVVYHEGSVSIGPRSARRVYFATRNHLLVASGIQPARRGLRVARGLSILSLNVAFVLTSGTVARIAGLRSVVQGVRDHLAGRYGNPR